MRLQSRRGTKTGFRHSLLSFINSLTVVPQTEKFIEAASVAERRSIFEALKAGPYRRPRRFVAQEKPSPFTTAEESADSFRATRFRIHGQPAKLTRAMGRIFRPQRIKIRAMAAKQRDVLPRNTRRQQSFCDGEKR